MQFFNRKEATFIVSVLVLIFLISYISYLASLRRTRDIERSSDISNLSASIIKFKKDFGFYPPSSMDGKILACYVADENIEYYEIKKLMLKDKMAGYEFILENARACEWGVDSLNDLTDLNYPAYITLIPKDPKHENGRQYYYKSDGNSYELYGSYEGKAVEGFDQNIKDNNLVCGSATCNFGKVSE